MKCLLKQDHAARRFKGMNKETLEQLEDSEAKALKALGGANGLLRLVEELRRWIAEGGLLKVDCWQLRDACDGGLLKDCEHPEHNTIYLEEDYLETNTT